MPKIIFLNIVILVFLTGCADGILLLHQESQPVIEEAFKTEAVFKNPESILFDPLTRQLFVANVNGHPLAKDGNGFISKVAINGDIRDLHWITGLNGPKGMTLIGDLLYVADIDQLVVIDITNNNKTFYSIENAKFLNDITHDDSGVVYISDFLTDTIYTFRNQILSVWLHDSQLKSPNGLYVEGDSLYVGSWGRMVDGFNTEQPGHLLRVSLVTKEISVATRQLGNLVGVGRSGDFFILTDSMAGSLLVVDRKGGLVDRIEVGPGAADLCVLPEDWELLVIPMMHDNLLQGFTLKIAE